VENNNPNQGNQNYGNQMPPNYGNQNYGNQMPPNYGGQNYGNQMPPNYGNQNGYNVPPPGYGYPPPPQRTPEEIEKGEKKQKISLVWGILSIVISVFGIIFGTIAIIFGVGGNNLADKKKWGGIISGIFGIAMNIFVVPIALAIIVPVAIGRSMIVELSYANQNADVVFDAAQSVCQDYENQGGMINAIVIFNGDDIHDEFLNYTGPGDLTVYELENEIRQNCNFENIKNDEYDDIEWMVYIENNRVISAIFNVDDDYVGGSPVPQTRDERNDNRTRWHFDSNTLLNKAVG
jgi:hypothetical protein